MRNKKYITNLIILISVLAVVVPPYFLSVRDGLVGTMCAGMTSLMILFLKINIFDDNDYD